MKTDQKSIQSSTQPNLKKVNIECGVVGDCKENLQNPTPDAHYPHPRKCNCDLCSSISDVKSSSLEVCIAPSSAFRINVSKDQFKNEKPEDQIRNMEAYYNMWKKKNSAVLMDSIPPAAGIRKVIDETASITDSMYRQWLKSNNYALSTKSSYATIAAFPPDSENTNTSINEKEYTMLEKLSSFVLYEHIVLANSLDFIYSIRFAKHKELCLRRRVLQIVFFFIIYLITIYINNVLTNEKEPPRKGFTRR